MAHTEAFSDCPLKNGTMVVFSKDMNFHERMILSDSLIPLQYCAVCEKIARVSVFKFSQCFAHRCRICSPLRRQSITSQKPRTSMMNTNMIIVLNKCYLKLYVSLNKYCFVAAAFPNLVSFFVCVTVDINIYQTI